MVRQIARLRIPRDVSVPVGSPSAPEWAAQQAFKARTDPLTTGTAGQEYARSPLTNLPKWFKRTWIDVDRFLADGGTIQDALDAVSASGADVVFDSDGAVYTVPNAGLAIKSGTRIRSKGSRAAVLTAPAGATGTAILKEANFARHITIEGLELDCNNHATMRRGFSSEYNDSGVYRDLRLIDIVVRNALDYGMFTWQSNGVLIERPQVYNCGYGIYASSPQGPVRIVNPVIINTVAGRMLFGIRCNSASLNADLEILAPHIVGADYASPFGAEAHGISISGTPAWKVLGGYITLCGNPANRQGGGLVVATSHGGSCEGLTSNGNYATGIWSELEPSGDTTLGTAGQIRGAEYMNIHVNLNGGAGLSASYGAGTAIVNIEAAKNGSEGVVFDCDGFSMSDFRAYNNWQNAGASAPAQNGGAKAGVRGYNGGRARLTSGHCYDNQAAKTQAWGVALDASGHLLTSIVTRDADHITGGLREGTPGIANTKTAVVTA